MPVAGLLSKYKALLVLAVCASLSACSSMQKTEQQKYEELQTSLFYSSYRAVSNNTIGPILTAVNYSQQVAADTPQNDQTATASKEEGTLAKQGVNRASLHALLSAIYSFSSFCTWSTVEADLSIEHATDDSGLYVAYTSQSLAQQCNGWPGLANQFSAKASLLEDSDNLAKRYNGMRITSKVILGLHAVQNGNGPGAQHAFEELAEKINQPWLPIAMHISAMILDPGALASPEKIKALIQQQDGLTYSERKKLMKLEELAKQNTQKPQKATKETKELVKQWTLEGLVEFGNIAADATYSALMKFLSVLGKVGME